MAAIALGKTIEAAYRFAFANILSVFGVIWLPSLIFLAALGTGGLAGVARYPGIAIPAWLERFPLQPHRRGPRPCSCTCLRDAGRFAVAGRAYRIGSRVR